MKSLAAIITVLLMLAGSSPVLACITGSAATQLESACCRAMQGHCPQNAKANCCRLELRTNQPPQEALLTAGSHSDASLQWSPVNAEAYIQPPNAAPLPHWQTPSPPDLTTTRITVLRI